MSFIAKAYASSCARLCVHPLLVCNVSFTAKYVLVPSQEDEVRASIEKLAADV